MVASSDGPRQRELAEAMGVEDATMTRHLDRLEADGLVTRRRDPADRRAFLVELTARGRNVHAHLVERMHAVHEACWDGISERDRADVRRVALRLQRNLDRLDADLDRRKDAVGD